MCGIIGTVMHHLPKEMLEPILQRGPYRATVLIPKVGEIRFERPLTWERIHDTLGEFVPTYGTGLGRPLLVHTQAPTGEVRSFEWHPFTYRGVIAVATNGVLHDTSAHENDCAEIPRIIYRRGWEGLSDLKGAFASWCLWDSTVHLFRWANPLYYSAGYFSSEPFKGSEELEEGIVMKWPTCERIARFNCKWHPYK